MQAKLAAEKERKRFFKDPNATLDFKNKDNHVLILSSSIKKGRNF